MPLTPLQQLLEEYVSRFDHGIPLQTLQEMAKGVPELESNDLPR